VSSKLDGGLVPQADSLPKVRELVRAVAARRPVPIRDAGLAAGLSPRHAAYYGRAAETLGLIIGGDHAYEVSALGQQLLATEAGSETERAAFRDAFARSPLMAIDPQLLVARYEPSREKLSSRIETMTGLSWSTAHRRAGTLLAWREFMLAQPQLEFAAPDGARPAAPVGTDYLDIRRLGPVGEARVEFGDLTVLVGPQATGKSLLLQMWKLAVDRGFVIPELRRLGSDLSTPELAVGAYLGAGMGGVWGAETEVRGSRGELNQTNVGNLTGTRESTEKLLYVPAHRSLLMTEHGWPLRLEGGRAPLVARLLADRLVRYLSDGESNVFPRSGKLDASLRFVLNDAIFRGGRLVLRREGGQQQLRLEYGERTSLTYLTWTAGQREAVPLLLVLYQLLPAARRPLSFDYLVVEEPEMGLHPRAIRAIMLLLFVLVGRGYRVAVTTHAPVVLDLVWALKHLHQLAAAGATEQAVALFREMFELHPDPAIDAVAASVLGKTSRVFAFEPAADGTARARDISTLDPASDDPQVAGWGGLAAISSRVSEAVGAAVEALDRREQAEAG
jgi:hypothetical protein